MELRDKLIEDVAQIVNENWNTMPHEDWDTATPKVDWQLKGGAINELVEYITQREQSLRQQLAEAGKEVQKGLDMLLQKWIPVSERLPTQGDGPIRQVGQGFSVEVLAYDGRFYKVRSFFAGITTPGLWSCSSADDITHWQPIPSVPPAPGKEATERIYPCAKCGTMRSKAEGGTTFTVCDDCWNKPGKEADNA